jgi:hypothetical protein
MLTLCVRRVEGFDLVKVEVREIDLSGLFSRILQHLNTNKVISSKMN